eukprot:CAMPEP_0117758122 /NCGR_PEP_ID=MMETSP0947-20121206/15180_1 /TAXON_ID=44440 /ORGANISM="Chattonella subsalsa, Strain CCMP2191" /LENGTH=201 /DNA_ID=CAMNT_0005578229 /DNA_START=315 /DNA_END=920 /DNA_ORIENTATION=+
MEWQPPPPGSNVGSKFEDNLTKFIEDLKQNFPHADIENVLQHLMWFKYDINVIKDQFAEDKVSSGGSQPVVKCTQAKPKAAATSEEYARGWSNQEEETLKNLIVKNMKRMDKVKKDMDASGYERSISELLDYYYMKFKKSKKYQELKAELLKHKNRNKEYCEKCQRVGNLLLCDACDNGPPLQKYAHVVDDTESLSLFDTM